MAITPGGLDEAIFLPIGRIRQLGSYLIPLAELPVLRAGSPANRRMQERLYRLSVGKMHSFYFAK